MTQRLVCPRTGREPELRLLKTRGAVCSECGTKFGDTYSEAIDLFRDHTVAREK